MTDSISIGSSPIDEKCAQVGSVDYYSRARHECTVFINQLRRVFGPEPSGARLYIKSNEHDFGAYYEVECRFNDDMPESVEYAFRCEAETPQRWDDEALNELNGLDRVLTFRQLGNAV